MSIEQNIENLEIRNANVVTFVGSSSTIVDTISGRIQCKGFQHNSNVITDISGPHGRVAPTLKKYPEIIFADGKFDSNESTNTYVQAGYTVTASWSQDPDGDANPIWKAFNGITSETGMLINNINYDNNGNANTTASRLSDSTPYGEWLKLKLPNKIKLNKYAFTSRNTSNWPQSAEAGQVWGSDNDSDWVHLHTFTNSGFTGASQTASFKVTTNNYYKYYAFIVTKTFAAGTDGYLCIPELEYYGYEENPPAGDHSVDTTFKSRFNNPQLTGVQVFVDGKGSGSNQISGGPDVTGTTTYNESGKHWELNGQLTSNITMEANTFLSGDAPHSLSMWFNSSNLEANVSNTCVFSISDQEHLNSQNLNLQSNTWHNLTYAYQGEGGSKVTYLDGRKVAENQAEDTFGEYPPFAMTGYSQGGYVVSASSENSSFPAHEAFKNFPQIDSVRWQTNRVYQSTGLPHAASPTTLTYKGEWIQLEQPYKLKINYLKMQAHSQQQHQPENWVILGSNDGTIWEFIKERLDASPFNVDSNGYHINTDVIDSPKFYKYHRIVITKSGATAGTEQPIVIGISLYGHRENDLVRLPDPTNVLKYPHIEFPIGSNSNDPASIRGYVVSGSSSSNSGIGRRPWSAFNDLGEGTANLGGVWQNLEDGSNHKYTPQTTGLATTNAALFEGVRGEWIKLELPRKLKVSQVYILTGAAHEGVEKAILYGSNDDTIWDVIKDSGTAGTGFTFTLTANGGLKEATESVTTSNYYKYLLLQVTEVVVGSGSTDGRSLQLYKLRYYGTEEATSIPIQIGGGNIDKVANFRVYDKFVGEDQALEIWDAQKDEFGRAKSSMTLQKGRLGLGTTEPEGRLAVADEPHNLEEFPPRAGGFDGDEWYMEGHGTFKACASNYHDSTDYYPGRAFTKSLVVNFGYASLSDSTVARWSGNSGLPNQSSSDPVGSFQGHQGDWLELELPYRIRVKSFQIQTRLSTYSPGDHPKNGFLYGSNNRENWTQVTEFTNLSYTPSQLDGIGGQKAIWNIDSETGFKYLRLLTTQKIDGSDAWLMISELKYFGTREQGQSVLHDGQLTLTKNLTVPRIGPALDADDTPRRDRLVVEYNTSTNPTFEGAVRDTSGRGLDGVFVGEASYDATEKAFMFDGTGDYIETFNIGNPAGESLFSGSFWYNPIGPGSDSFVWIGGQEAVGKAFIFKYNLVNFEFSFYGNDAVFNYTLQNGTWYHIAFAYSGGTASSGRRIWVNGVEVAYTSGASSTALNLDANTELRIGGRIANNTNDLHGSLSNFKLYDTALTAEEVKTLYDMGRCDEGHHVVNFSKTRVGIGLGDGEAPRGALDVKDEAVFSSILCQASPEDLKNDVESKGVHEVLLTFEGKKTTTDNKIHEGIQFKHYSSHQTGYRGITWQSSSDHNSSQPDFLMGGVTMAVGGSYNSCSVNFHAAASKVNGETRRAYINSGNNGNRITTFTGQHRCVLHDISLNNIESYEGMIVSANKNQYMNVNGTISRGSNAITINESIPIVTMSNIEKDKKCFGVISTSEDTETREEQHGNLTSLIEKEKGDTRVYINSIGEGAIWVSNIGGNLESGDYITTSNVAGYGQKQDGAGLMNYTVAKITMDCDFEPATQPIQQILRSNVIQTYYLGDVHKVKTVPHEFVTTVVGANDTWSNVSIKPSDVTYAEWSNLEANTQNTYTLTYTQTSNVVYDTKYTLTTTSNVTESDAWDRVSIDPPDVTYAQYSNLEANTQSSYSLTFTKTTTDEKTTEEWSALESNTQSLYNMVYYQSVEEEVASDYPGATTHTRVTDVIENELDEHGQIQWEDHATDTEKAYKVRYLAADGTQTDEANAVHIAAFVGCTYHCG